MFRYLNTMELGYQNKHLPTPGAPLEADKIQQVLYNVLVEVETRRGASYVRSLRNLKKRKSMAASGVGDGKVRESVVINSL